MNKAENNRNAFNQTNVELKCKTTRKNYKREKPFNQTNVELKSMNARNRYFLQHAFNQTNVELKFIRQVIGTNLHNF